MVLRATLIWVAGLLTLVPWGAYYLLFEAPREQYALLIVGLLFWVFGYWGLAGPVLLGLKVRAVARAIQRVRSRDDLLKTLHSPDARALRILSEYLEPAARLRREKIRDTIVFFGSARINAKAAAEAALEDVRRELEEHAAPDESLAAKLRRAERFCRLAEYYDDAYELSRRITEWSKSLTGSRHFVVASGGGSGSGSSPSKLSSCPRWNFA